MFKIGTTQFRSKKMGFAIQLTKTYVDQEKLVQS
jgi:hypothetical protein